MISLYRPGSSLLHRIHTGWKFLGLLITISLVTVLARGTDLVGVIALGIAAVILVTGYLVSGFGLRELWRQVLLIRWLIVALLVLQLIFLSFDEALVNTGRVVIAVLLAALFTLTTPTTSILDLVQRVAHPLARFGVNPARIGLVLSLTITSIPVIADFARQIREAQQARGARLAPHLLVVPLLVMALKHADDSADALAARGVD